MQLVSKEMISAVQKKQPQRVKIQTVEDNPVQKQEKCETNEPRHDQERPIIHEKDVSTPFMIMPNSS